MNKVQKIRNEVERLRNELMQEREKGYGSDADDTCILELQNVLTYIDSLQEKTVKDRLAFKAIPRLLDMIEPSERAKNYVTKLADAFDAEGYHTDAKIVRESLKIMNGEKVPMATMDEESVSDDLGEYIYELSKRFPEVSFAKLSRIAVRVAKWQKEQMMAKAINTEASLTMSVPTICISLPLGVNVGDKVKVIVIKED